MKNLTLSIDDEVLREVRRYAADKGTTVNAIVRDHLTRIATQEDKAAKARRELLELARNSTWDPGPDYKWNREELYERATVPRLEHPDLHSNESGSGAGKDASRRGDRRAR